MKKIITLFIAVLLFTAPLSAQTARYVVLVSVDGFRPDFYTDPSWPAPNMQQLLQQGVYAQGVRGIFPTVTYPSHTTLITGVRPARHGIVYNTPFEPQGQSGDWFREERDIKVPTLWDAVRSAGLKSAAVSWPVSVGAPVDYNIPETWSRSTPGDRRGATSEQATPKGLFEEVQERATGQLEANDLNLYYLGMNENLARMTAYLVKQYKPNLVMVHLPCTDAAQHREGREGAGVRRAVASADHAIGTILEALQKAGIKDSTAVIITGDHGFVDTHSSLAPNVWLAQHGLTGKAEDRGNWKAAFHSAGGSTFLHMKDPKDEKTLQQVRKILAGLPPAQQKLFRVIDRAGLQQSGADPEAVLALAAVQGITFSNAADGPELRPAKGGAHGYFPDFNEIRTGFIAAGPGLNKGSVLPEIGLEDIAPLIARLLSIELPQAEGVVYPGMLAPAGK
ncbi:alkaline phosphatase family protein [Chitinophaga japonensis]|uniref:Putative AlkP superfamily pyrophosphatase or phosphodiesterase n=1 Tax=Chitinophaga japonensis TaxID=104662 RepID=A0A562TBV7_CHIJA|nr:ectonucleotide pyrophosphatase/phosphodiesterase [Chitinophaga japonensis]TWI91002.1 putative AlkP superfamily pyrophosphatase or phosphodiesterase [Chitinophaga japonensis]